MPAYSRPPTPEVLPLQIGFVGLGAMGYLMARNLANHKSSHPAGSIPLVVWNRTLSKSEQLLEELGKEKIRIASSPGQLATECDVIITNLANDVGVEDIYKRFASALKNFPAIKHKIFVETSTIYPTIAGELDILISSTPHAHLVASPVFGAPAAADKAQLIIAMSGDYRSKRELAYLLVPALAKKVIDLGGDVRKAPTLKLIGNSVIMGFLDILAESFTFAEKSGIGATVMNDLIKDILPAGPLVAYGDKLVRESFDGTNGFAIDGEIKDVSHIRRLSAEHNSPMPLIDIAYQHLLTTRALHAAQTNKIFETLDSSAMIAATRAAAGLDAFDGGKQLPKAIQGG